jgi:hypothetical protein
MEKIINTETDSDVKLREEANNKLLLDSLNNFKIEGKSALLLKSLHAYFTEEKIKKIIPLITGSSRISLRVIDWFVTNYSKKNQIIYKIKENDEECYINIHTHYRSQLNAYGKKYIDPFCRGAERIMFKVSETQCLTTNISQLNFFKWALQYNVLDYIDKNYSIIVKDMTETINSTPASNKRRIFSSNTVKAFKKYEDGISIDIHSSESSTDKNDNIYKSP